MILTNGKKFAEDVLNKDFVLVDFYADWCGPCRMISPILEEIQSEMNIDVAKINVDESPNVATEYNVMSIPTVIIFKKGKKISVNVGAASKEKIIEWIRANQ